MTNLVTDEKLEKYFKVSREALQKAKEHPENLNLDNAREEFLDMIERYINDADHFKKMGRL